MFRGVCGTTAYIIPSDGKTAFKIDVKQAYVQAIIKGYRGSFQAWSGSYGRRIENASNGSEIRGK